MKVRMEVGPMTWVENYISSSPEEVKMVLEQRYRLRAEEITEVDRRSLPYDAVAGWKWPGVHVFLMSPNTLAETTSPEIPAYQRDMVIALQALDLAYIRGSAEYSKMLAEFQAKYGE